MLIDYHLYSGILHLSMHLFMSFIYEFTSVMHVMHVFMLITFDTFLKKLVINGHALYNMLLHVILFSCKFQYDDW